MSIVDLQAKLEEAMQDFVYACHRYEDCLHNAPTGLFVDRQAYSAMCDKLDAERKARRKAIREIAEKLKAFPGGYEAVSDARRRLDTWARVNGYREMLSIYEPLA